MYQLIVKDSLGTIMEQPFDTKKGAWHKAKNIANQFAMSEETHKEIDIQKALNLVGTVEENGISLRVRRSNEG